MDDRALGYIRVSTQEQADSGLGLAAQRRKIRDEARRRGWQVVDVLADEGVSASEANRPALADALERLDRGDADVLVVSRMDRIYRGVLPFAEMLERAKRRKWRFVSLDSEMDLSKPSGRLHAQILMAVAEYERELIAQRTREALAEAKARGVRLGRPVQVPQPIRERIAAEYKAGRTLTAIGTDLDREGVKPPQGAQWWPSSVRSVIRSLQNEGWDMSQEASTE
jgi:DNA invertase Pin-like site-specific DNA recombinase